MNILDIIILICLIPALIQGIRKGFISQIIGIVSIIAGVWASSRFASLVSNWLSQYLTGSEQLLRIISFVLIFILVIIGLALLGKLLEATIKIVMLGWVNRLLGAMFSIFNCLLVLGLISLAFTAINETFSLVKPEVINGSLLYPIVEWTADNIFPYLKQIFTLK